MPLDYDGDNDAVSNNIKTEMNAGKPQKQAIAIAENVKRNGPPKGKRKKSVKAEVAEHMDKMKKGLRT